MKSAANTQPDLNSEAEAALQPKPSEVEAGPTNARPADNTQKAGAIGAKQLGAGASEAQAARIFDEANTQLSGPVSNARRSAIQHLRAAASAIKAELRAGGAIHSAINDQPYRKDLQSAVRPRCPDRCCDRTSCKSSKPGSSR